MSLTASEERTTPPTLASEQYVVATMPRFLSTKDLLATFIVILLFITNTPNAVAGGAAGLTFWIVGAITFLLPCVVVTAQLGVMFPYEGSLYNWTYKALGNFWGFFATFLYWVPSPILILATADLIISYLQGLHSNWLVQPWQQGCALIGLILFSALIARFRYRAVQHMINATVFLLLLCVLLLGAAGILWLQTGHHSATNFSLANWAISWSPWWNPLTGNGNFGLFGLITLGYLGVNIPLNMAGEMLPTENGVRKRMITRHLFWGPVIVVLAYLIVTWAILVVQGGNGAYALFSIVSTIDMALGPICANLAALCIIVTFFLATVTYNYSYARLLMVGAIDNRIPARIALLNRHRIPDRAIWIQTVAAIGLAALFFLILPLLVSGTKAADLVTQVYFVSVASGTVLWACGTIFLFFNMLKLVRRASQQVKAARLFSPMLLTLLSMVGTVTGIIAVIDTIANSWTPLIPNAQWWLIITCLTVSGLAIGAISSMFASSQASWEKLTTMERGEG